MSMHGKKRDSAIEPMQETGDSYSKRMKLSQDRLQTGAHPEYEIVEDSNKQNDWTHLHEAASQIDLPRLDYLLELGKHDINAVTRESRHTALHKAVLCWFRIAKQIEKHGDHLEAINLLLDYGANPNIHDRSSETVLHAAVQTSSLDMTRVLIDCGAAVNVRSKKYETAPYGPAMEVLISMVLIDGTRHQIQLLLDYGAAIDAFDDYFGTPLHCAALYDNLEACQLLLESEEGLKCLTIEDEQGCVPVRLATTSAIEILRLLLEKGAAVDVSVDQESSHAHGGTALSRACGYEQILGNTKETNTVVIQTLLVAGADPNKAVGSGSTPIVIALRSKNLTAVKVMLDNGVLDSRLAGYWDNRVVLGAAAMGNRYVWRKSIQVGVDVNMVLTNDDGYRAIHIAAGYGNGDTVKTLVEGGATIEARTSQGLRPLHMACARGTVDCVKALLQLGAEIDATDFNRMNSLQLAAFNGHLEVVRTLLDPSRIMVVVVGHRVTTGLSAADLAMSKGHGAVTDFLVKAGDLQHLDRQFWE